MPATSPNMITNTSGAAQTTSTTVTLVTPCRHIKISVSGTYGTDYVNVNFAGGAATTANFRIDAGQQSVEFDFHCLISSFTYIGTGTGKINVFAA